MDFNKLLLAFFGLILSVNLSAQNLAFSRVIDTILIVQTGPEPVDISTKFIGETLSPEAGKVFKVNNIFFQELHIPNQQNGVYNSTVCGDPSQDIGYLKSGVDVYDGDNEFVLSKKGAGTGMVEPLDALGSSSNKFPLWINSNSTLRTYVMQAGYEPELLPYHQCVKNYMAKAYISLIEFHTEAQ